MKIETCEFVPLTSLVPKKWENWFYEAISTNAPFSWGDNNRTLISLNRFYDHCKEVLENHGLDYGLKESGLTKKSKDKFLKTIVELTVDYIDLEN